jgi:phytoene desaturase
VVVIGAGLGGLAAACHLLERGHQVTIVEREDEPGGRAGQWRANGFAIDTGPSVLTMPDILAATFDAVGTSMEDHLDLRPLDPLYRACFADGAPIRVRRGRREMVEEIRARCGSADADAFGPFADWLERLWRVEAPHFIDRNFDSPLDLLRPARPAIDLIRLGALRRMSAVVEGRFEDPRLRKLFSFQALYAGLSPFEALAVFCVITFMDTVNGVWFPTGGIHAVARALAQVVEGAGAILRWGTPVTDVVRRPGRAGAVTGVRTGDGEVIAADAVVCNPDLPVAYRDLLPGVAPPRRVRRGDYSPSCVLWLAGVRGPLPPDVAHHNVHFGEDWQGSFDALRRTGRRQPDPSILVSVPTVTDASLAPPGCHVLYALEPTPNLDGAVPWATERERARDDLRHRLERFGYPVGEVIVERFTDPTDWERLGMERGTPFALAHRIGQSGPFRPANVDRRVPGLVFVGSGTVPGVGVPMVLLSGKLAAARVDQLAAGR